MLGGTCRQRLQALRRLGNDVTAINSTARRKQRPTTAARLIKRLGMDVDLTSASNKALQFCLSFSPDVIWLDKATTIPPRFFQACTEMMPRPMLVGYSPDDMAGRHNQTSRFLSSLPYYDIYFTTKSYNVKELTHLGAREVKFVGNGYDPVIHAPTNITPAQRITYGGSLGFIGAWEQDRAEFMDFIGKHGTVPRWWCGSARWTNRRRHNHIQFEKRSLWQSEYRIALNSFEVQLCFLRKINRDLQTQRSVEIPACSQFMLAERTDEHLEMFTEGEEAEFFSCREELLSKAKFYLQHETTRKRIAEKGYTRCVSSGYSNDSRLSWMLSQLRL